MNQKGAHLRQSFDLGTYTSAMPSPTPTTSAVLPLSQPALHPTPTLFAPSPTSAVASLNTLDQLLRDIDVPSTGTDASAVSPNILPPFNRRLPRRSNIHFRRRTCHLRCGHARQPQYHTLQGNTENYVNKILNINSYFGGACITSNHYLFHRRRRAGSLISLYAGCCSRRRLRHSLTRTRPLRISSPNFMICTSK